jgi:hypothetical protein
VLHAWLLLRLLQLVSGGGVGDGVGGVGAGVGAGVGGVGAGVGFGVG